MKSDNWHLTDGMEVPNQDKIRTLAENETYKYWASWRVTLSSKGKWKKKLRNNISEELENSSRQNTLAGTLSKE